MCACIYICGFDVWEVGVGGVFEFKCLNKLIFKILTYKKI